MKLKIALGLIVFSCLAFPAKWEIDGAHAGAKFKIRHLTVSNVSGEVGGMKGSFDIDDKDASKLSTDASVDMTTISTNNAKRDEHLKSPDFFDTKKFPSATFKSKKVTKGAGDKLTIVGDLTLKGVTKEVSLEGELTAAIKDPYGSQRRGFSATGKINRKDFGVTWNKVIDNGGLALSEEVDITIDCELTPAAPAKGKTSKS